jgi:hypothetical protein
MTHKKGQRLILYEYTKITGIFQSCIRQDSLCVSIFRTYPVTFKKMNGSASQVGVGLVTPERIPLLFYVDGKFLNVTLKAELFLGAGSIPPIIFLADNF